MKHLGEQWHWNASVMYSFLFKNPDERLQKALKARFS